jgi:hypothetical protein
MAYRLSLADGIGIFGIILAVVCLVLDKAGKLKGGWLVGLLILAGVMTRLLERGAILGFWTPPRSGSFGERCLCLVLLPSHTADWHCGS